MQIVHMETPHTLNPKVPDLDVNYVPSLQEQGWRGGLKPLNVVQPQGPSFKVAFPGWLQSGTYPEGAQPFMHGCDSPLGHLVAQQPAQAPAQAGVY